MQEASTLYRCFATVALAVGIRNAITSWQHNAHAVVSRPPSGATRGAALVFYPYDSADHNGAYELDAHARQRALELAATVVRVGRVGAASNWLAHASPNSLRHVSLGGHGNGTRVMWGDGRCHESDRTCGLWPGNKGFLALLSSRLTERAVVVLESCYALPLAPEIAKALRGGARVFATDACYNQEHLKYVLDASGDLVPMLLDPWHASTRMHVLVAPECHDMPWIAPEWLRTLGVTGCADVTMDVCLSDDADGEVLDHKGQGPASACCRCGAGWTRSSWSKHVWSES